MEHGFRGANREGPCCTEVRNKGLIVSALQGARPGEAAELAQVLEDAMGCRSVVASMLMLDLPAELAAELASCDEHLSRLIAEARRRLGLDPDLN